MNKITSADVERGYVTHSIRVIDKTKRELQMRFPDWQTQLKLAEGFSEGANKGKMDPIYDQLIQREPGTSVAALLRGALVTDLCTLEPRALEIVFGTIDPNDLRVEAADPGPLPDGMRSGLGLACSKSEPSEAAIFTQ